MELKAILVIILCAVILGGLIFLHIRNRRKKYQSICWSGALKSALILFSVEWEGLIEKTWTFRLAGRAALYLPGQPAPAACSQVGSSYGLVSSGEERTVPAEGVGRSRVLPAGLRGAVRKLWRNREKPQALFPGTEVKLCKLFW